MTKYSVFSILKLSTLFLISMFLFFLWNNVRAQNITYSSGTTLNVTKLSDLTFGNVYQNEGRVTVSLGDPGEGEFRIDGQKNMDVTVTITSSSQLTNTTNSNYTLPFTAEAAYANKGQDNPHQAKSFSLPTATFRIGGRNSGPPEPPPIPPHGNYTPPSGSAWIYCYGNIQVQNVNTGPYSGTFTLTVVYN